MNTLWGREPAAVTTFGRYLLLLAVLFGAGLSEAQIAGVMAVLESGLLLLTRSQVTPVRSIQELPQ